MYLSIGYINLSLKLSSNFITKIDQLKNVNEELWWVEDSIRENEKKQIFDKEFVELARAVYKLNDERSEIKRQINLLTKSNIIEEKSYS